MGQHVRHPVAVAALLILLGIALIVLTTPGHHSMRATANEAAAISVIRTVLDAERAYAADNDGGFGPLTCLVEPQECGAVKNVAPYLPPEFAASWPLQQGYRRALYLGPVVSAPRRQSAATFVISTWPVGFGTTGVRSFAADSELHGFRVAYTRIKWRLVKPGA